MYFNDYCIAQLLQIWIKTEFTETVTCSLVVTCWERADLLAVVFVVFSHFPKYVLVHIRIKGEVGAVKLV